jgi:dihydroorotate dehydrogenase
MINIFSNTSSSLYKHVAKPIFFKFDPEKVHDTTLTGASLAGKIPPINTLLRSSWAFSDTTLEQTVDGVKYINPIGLAAGWDKNAQAVTLMGNIGFGFTEVGSITKYSYPGNPGTRLWRLKDSGSIVVYYGLKNEGVDVLAPKIAGTKSSIPIGTNIARTNSPDCDDKSSIEDYAYSFDKLKAIGDYFTVNISCPNTFGGQPFHDARRLKMLLKELESIPTKKPVYIKISPDISQEERKDIAELASKYRVHGYICGNLTKNRSLTSIKEKDIPAVGGMSGKVVQELSDELIRDMYKYSAGTKTIIGLGGVFNAHDAYKKIKLGANLVQIITGLIYQGPQVVGQINKGLTELLAKDGYSNISQAVGKDTKINK